MFLLAFIFQSKLCIYMQDYHKRMVGFWILFKQKQSSQWHTAKSSGKNRVMWGEIPDISVLILGASSGVLSTVMFTNF